MTADLVLSLGLAEANIAPATAAARLGAALLCGGLIGVDREIHDRPAGLRTHMLVALASALFTILTFEIAYQALEQDMSANGVDPIRVVEALTAGVAFLAAGTIILHGGDVRGLTTGASLWLAGATGLAAGLGLYWIAYLATGAALAVLVAMQLAKVIAASARDALKRGLTHDDEGAKPPSP